jgi:hypothetical protein
MKRLLVKLMMPGLVASGLAAVMFLATIKRIEDRYSDEYFWE